MQVEELLAQVASLRENAHVRTVFGEPIRHGDRIVIPVAQVRGGFGLGFGRGKEPAGGGTGAGGGGMFRARPVAVIEITPGEVQVRPVVDVTRIVLAAMLLAAWVTFWGSLTARTLVKRAKGS